MDLHFTLDDIVRISYHKLIAAVLESFYLRTNDATTLIHFIFIGSKLYR